MTFTGLPGAQAANLWVVISATGIRGQQNNTGAHFSPNSASPIPLNRHFNIALYSILYTLYMVCSIAPIKQRIIISQV